VSDTFSDEKLSPRSGGEDDRLENTSPLALGSRLRLRNANPSLSPAGNPQIPQGAKHEDNSTGTTRPRQRFGRLAASPTDRTKLRFSR
jgi:hypothetical protein